MRVLALLPLLLLLAGCDTASYYMQALRGQAEMWHATRPIDAIMADPEAPHALKERLERAVRIREFASEEPGCPTTGLTAATPI